MSKIINYSFIFVYIFILIICIFFVPIFYSNNSIYKDDYSHEILLSGDGFFWPIPGYTYISSYFGKRTSPTSGASTYHSGIDIPASENSKLYAVDSGYISFASWGAGGGYTIVLDLEDHYTSVSYCHLSPNFIVTRNQYVHKGELIAYVGPKNVYGIANNPYKDSNGNPTNGATTGPHLHLTIKKEGTAVNPLDYF